MQRRSYFGTLGAALLLSLVPSHCSKMGMSCRVMKNLQNDMYNRTRSNNLSISEPIRTPDFLRISVSLPGACCPLRLLFVGVCVGSFVLLGLPSRLICSAKSTKKRKESPFLENIRIGLRQLFVVSRWNAKNFFEDREGMQPARSAAPFLGGRRRGCCLWHRWACPSPFLAAARRQSNASSPFVTPYGAVFTPSRHNDPGSSSSSFSTSGTTPLVVTIGWLGCQPRHLQKFTGWYQAQGCDTLAYIPTIATMLTPSLGQRRAADVWQTIRSLSAVTTSEAKEEEATAPLKRKPIVFHTFSNNGTFFWARLLAHSLKHPDLQRLLKHSTAACIFDSSPSEISIDIFVRGFTGAILGMLFPHKGEAIYHHSLLSPMLRALFLLYSSSPSLKRHVSSVLDAVAVAQPRCPQMYLYSTADHLIPYQQIEAIIQAQKDAGLDVCSKRWTDSAHVNHFRMHKEEYCDAVNSFLKDCLPRWEQQRCNPSPSSSPDNDDGAVGDDVRVGALKQKLHELMIKF
ncbi:hypothetical protein QOT17_012378 [Balamuthia mandrillaris]